MKIAMTAEMRHFLIYRGVHVLCTIKKKKLSATHYTLYLGGGRSPMWGIWSAVTGKFIRFHSSREAIEKAYPKLVWRKVIAQWGMQEIVDLPWAKRQELLHEHLEGRKDDVGVVFRVVEGGKS